MNPLHMQTIHTEAIRADHMQRAERHRLAPSRPSQTTARDRLRAVAIAFRKPELVRARHQAASAPRGC